MSAVTLYCTKLSHKMMTVQVLTVCLAGDMMLECSRNVIMECISILNLKGKLGKKLFPCLDYIGDTRWEVWPGGGGGGVSSCSVLSWRWRCEDGPGRDNFPARDNQINLTQPARAAISQVEQKSQETGETEQMFRVLGFTEQRQTEGVVWCRGGIAGQ